MMERRRLKGVAWARTVQAEALMAARGGIPELVWSDDKGSDQEGR